MSEVNEAIRSQFSAMESIDSVVKQTLAQDAAALQDAGRRLAASLRAWNEALPTTERNATGWVIKKANDSIRYYLRRTLQAELNTALGFPADFDP